jgi:hypothetical protein
MGERPRESLPPSYFADVHRANADPWGFETSPYEAAKYDATLAALPRERYRCGLEIGCWIGALTARPSGVCRIRPPTAPAPPATSASVAASQVGVTRLSPSVEAITPPARPGQAFVRLVHQELPGPADVRFRRRQLRLDDVQHEVRVAAREATGQLGRVVATVVGQDDDLVAGAVNRPSDRVDLMGQGVERGLDPHTLVAERHNDADVAVRPGRRLNERARRAVRPPDSL